MSSQNRHILLLVLAMLLALSACATTGLSDKAKRHLENEEWIEGILEIRRLSEKHPRDIELKSQLTQLELKVAEIYYKRGREQWDKGNLDSAMNFYQQGLIAMPNNSKLQQAVRELVTKREADAYYRDGLKNQEIERYDAARNLFEKAIEAYPKHKHAALALEELKSRGVLQNLNSLILTSRAPITLNFKKTDIKTALEFVAKSFGINVIFDEDIKPTSVVLFAENVTFDQALNLILKTTKTFYKKIGKNTILVAPDSKEKRGQYEDHIIRTIYLKTIKAKDMIAVLKGILPLKKVIVNEQLNAIVVRDTADMLELTEQLIEANDRKPAELLVEVEILEVNRTKAEQLGLDFGSEISATFPQFGITKSFSNAIKAGTVTLPNFAFRYFKQDVDAKILANPKVRVLNAQSSKIHIGDKVPLRSSSIQDATGQTRTTFEYKDIGIKLTVKPDIHLDNSVTVDLGLEVSTLGSNLGTQDEPAFSIGTRNAESVMLLRDGETAILGGLIRDEDRNARVGIPGLGDIPVVGNLFSTHDNQDSRTDVLLTITPRVLRTWELPSKKVRNILSGTENSYKTSTVFGFLNHQSVDDASPKITTEQNNQHSNNVSKGGPLGAIPNKESNSQTTSKADKLVLAFDQPSYEIKKGDMVEVTLVAQNLTALSSLPLELAYNPQILEFVDGVGTSGYQVATETADKKVKVTISNLQQDTVVPQATLAKIKFKAVQNGISYLIYGNTTFEDAAGNRINAQVKASRVSIK